MSKFTYHPRLADPETVTVFGFVFEKGKPTEVSDPKAAAKLKNNPFFKAVVSAPAKKD